MSHLSVSVWRLRASVPPAPLQRAARGPADFPMLVTLLPSSRAANQPGWPSASLHAHAATQRNFPKKKQRNAD